MSQFKTVQPKYLDGRTKQSFKDETDINKLLARAQKTGTISHLNKHEAHYGDFETFDFFEANLKLTAGREIFDDLPSEIRSEFDQSPAKFFQYVNDPENKDRLGKLLPGLAEPGKQLIDVKGNISADVEKARAASIKPDSEVAPTDQPAKPDNGVLKVSDAVPDPTEGPSSPST